MKTDINEITNEKLAVIVTAAVNAALSQGGYISIAVIGSVAEVTVGKVPDEISVDVSMTNPVT